MKISACQLPANHHWADEKTRPCSPRREKKSTTFPSSTAKLFQPLLSRASARNGTSTTATPIHLHGQISTRPIGTSLGYESFVPIPWWIEELGRLCLTNQHIPPPPRGDRELFWLQQKTSLRTPSHAAHPKNYTHSNIREQAQKKETIDKCRRERKEKEKERVK